MAKKKRRSQCFVALGLLPDGAHSVLKGTQRLGVVPLLRAEDGEEESQVGLVVPEDIRATEAETMILLILPRTPNRPSMGMQGPLAHRC